LTSPADPKKRPPPHSLGVQPALKPNFPAYLTHRPAYGIPPAEL
jgi:hypothetical protein